MGSLAPWDFLLTMRQSLRIWFAFGLLLYVVSATQVLFSNEQEESNSLEVSSMDLSAISQEFTVLSHPRFPTHQVRIKRSDFCDPTVRAWTGRKCSFNPSILPLNQSRLC